MPIYEYVCETCGEDFEVIQKFSDSPLKRHTCAPKSKVRRKLSLNAFQLKGGGWFSEGYAKNGSGNGSSNENGSSGKNEKAPGSSNSSANGSGKSDASSKSESKPASTGGGKPSGSPQASA